MLKSFEIEQLFGLYNYKIDLEISKDPGLLFVTGPNGMGKSTMLRLVNAIHSMDIKQLGVTPFAKITCTYDTCVLTFVRKETIVVDEQSESDVEQKRVIRLEYQYVSLSGTANESCVWEGNEDTLVDHVEGSANNLAMLKTSERCLYVPDNRLHVEANNGELLFLPEHMMIVLTKIQMRLAQSLSANVDGVERLPDDEIMKECEFLQKCGVRIPVTLESLSSQNYYMRELNMVIANQMLQVCKDDVSRLHAFYDIVNKCRFIDKDFVMSLDKGYRFVSRNADRTILDYWKLSSGEQHIMCLLMSLLFSDNSFSLVLIDEPEMSFHLMWQVLFLKHIRKIRSLRHCNFLIATHSTQVFDGQFELATDLFTQNRKLHGAR